jgi:hypothetical protein
MNTVFHEVYPDLEGKSLFKIFRPFTSIQNKSLVDYKKFRKYIESRVMAMMPSDETENKPVNPLSRNEPLKQVHTLNTEKLPMSPKDMKSPSLRRMEQIKEDILKAAESSPLLKNSYLAQKYEAAKSPQGDIGKKKTTLEALVSPRGSQNGKMTSQNRYQKLIKGGQRVMSPDRVSMTSKFSQYSTFSTPFFTTSNDSLKQKLAYEWKNVYRSLNSIDLNSSGYVTKKEFTSAIHNNGVFLTRDELAKLLKKYSKNGEVNYVRISNELGLHKSSYDYMRSSNKYLKVASVLKSIHGGFNDSKSQLGEVMKGAKTDRQHREYTKGAIEFVHQSKQKDIQKLIPGFDKKNTLKVKKSEF